MIFCSFIIIPRSVSYEPCYKNSLTLTEMNADLMLIVMYYTTQATFKCPAVDFYIKMDGNQWQLGENEEKALEKYLLCVLFIITSDY